MATWFLVLIYLAFISLGLPDSLLGSAWPVMWPELDASLGSAGIVAMVIAGGTIVSSLASGYLVERLGTGKVTLLSCALTAGALLGFSMSPSLGWLILLAVPLGLGGGSVDAALNHYVAEHYKAHHMNWLHCFWGVGATAGPFIMSAYLADNGSWQGGYFAVSMIQFALVAILLVTLPLWKRVAASRESGQREAQAVEPSPAPLPTQDANRNVLRLRGVKPSLLVFFFFCGAESTVGLWGASYLVGVQQVTAETAASWISLYYGGITVGRFITGFISLRVQNRVLIRGGQLVALSGGIMLFLPLPEVFSLVAIILIGLGLAPIYPALLHETPTRFGRENSAKLMGYQMAVAYTGTTLLPPFFGFMATQIHIGLFPYAVILLLVMMLLTAERVNMILRQRVKPSDYYV